MRAHRVSDKKAEHGSIGAVVEVALGEIEASMIA